VGGLVDETDVCLAVYGDDLEPADVTRLLGVEPSRSRRRGDSRRSGPPWPNGAWFLAVRGRGDPEALTNELLDKLPTEEGTWRELGARFTVQLRFGLFMERWNRGLEFSPELLARMARLNAKVIFDIYGPEGAPVDVQAG
jgi:hypothetical protein